MKLNDMTDETDHGDFESPSLALTVVGTDFARAGELAVDGGETTSSAPSPEASRLARALRNISMLLTGL
jgi:hypothetical protein